MFTLFDKTTTVSLHLIDDPRGNLSLAAQDLLNDLSLCDSQHRTFSFARDGAITVRLDSTLPHAEQYRITITDIGVDIAGADDLGAMWGIYAFSRDFLGVHPCIRMNDILPAQRDILTLAPQTVTDYPRGYRFRGWFLNDEDLLSDFIDSGYHRHLDYAFYGNVQSTDMLDRILETAVRLHINLIIPASFLNIAAEGERKLVECVRRRGLWVSQHHVEPLGVSYFTLTDFLKERGGNQEISYINNREGLTAAWEHYAKLWGEYDRVVWQLGLRGKTDQPVWHTDKSMDDNHAAHGAIISEAMQTQADIIRRVTGNPHPVITATLWMEGAELFNKGYLTIPDEAMLVYCDIGHNQLPADDFFRIGVPEGRKAGMYYHCAFWTPGPHLAEGTHPDKMNYAYDLMWQGGARDFSILNVSNVREFQWSIYANARLTWDVEAYAVAPTLREYCEKTYGQDISHLVRRHYESYSQAGDKALHAYSNFLPFDYHDYGTLPFPNFAMLDGFMKTWWFFRFDGKDNSYLPDADMQRLAYEGYERFSALEKELLALEIEPSRRNHFVFERLLQCQYIKAVYRWSYLCTCGEFEQAAQVLEAHIERRKVGEYGNWIGWYKGETKMNLRRIIERTRKYCQ